MDEDEKPWAYIADRKISKRINRRSPHGLILAWPASFIGGILDCFCEQDKTDRLVCSGLYFLQSCLLRKSIFPEKQQIGNGRVPLCCSSSTLLPSTSEKTNLSCSHFPSTRFHPLGRHPIRLLPFPSTGDRETSHLSHVAHSSDLHAGSLTASIAMCPCIELFSLIFPEWKPDAIPRTSVSWYKSWARSTGHLIWGNEEQQVLHGHAQDVGCFWDRRTFCTAGSATPCSP